MKQAILITAYKNYHHLEKIINFFDDNFTIYIHLDKKSIISKEQLIAIKNVPRVKLFVRKYTINWGSLNHLKSILYLIKKALEDHENYYFHLISGHDFPIKKRISFFEYFEKNKHVEHLNYFDVPKPSWGDNGGMDRLDYYNLCDLLNLKNYRHKKVIERFITLQKKVKFKRTMPSKMPKLFGGSTWWSLSRDCVQYVMNYTKENKFYLKRYKYTLCSEEFYFQSIIMNSSFALNVKNTNLRYIDWGARNGNNPAILDHTDLEKLYETQAFFARKFEYPESIEIINLIESKLNG